MTGSSNALHRLLLSLDEPLPADAPTGPWRWRVRQRMAAVLAELDQERSRLTDDWLAARSGTVLRERDALRGRLAALSTAVLASPDLDRVCAELRRLALDISRHCQRVNTLVYDEVELELGGSE